MKSLNQRLASDLVVSEKKIEAAVQLLDEGATVPFIARYRKEVTGGLDDGQLRQLEERLAYLRDLDQRRDSILSSIEEQGKLTPELKQKLLEADTKTRLEDLYQPFKQKRRTKGQIAIEAGIEPLADKLLENTALNPEQEAEAFINTDETYKESFVDAKGVLTGAKFILMERFAEDAELLEKLREMLKQRGILFAHVARGKEQEGQKFADYFDYQEAFGKIPSHRALALFRGRNESVLQLKLDVAEEEGRMHDGEYLIARHTGLSGITGAAKDWLQEVVSWTWKIKLQLKMETEFLADLRLRAETSAIEVFGKNLKDLLLSAPAGQKATLGLDPGLRTGVKLAVVDATGKYVDSSAIFPHAPRNEWDKSIATLASLCKQHQIKLLAIGNGTASRETDKLCAELIQKHPELGVQKVMVSEAGASVYSASETAAKEFPELDVTVRGAISIARRLQDPLSELVKIEPKSIGVGQYQHDVNQFQLAKNLESVVEDCVNSVGVEVNTASAALLQHVAGLNQTTAENIVSYRDAEGVFKSRKDLKKVPRLGDKTFEQAAGFLRIHKAENPLDASGVHPESYGVVSKMAKTLKTEVNELVNNTTLIKQLQPGDYTDDSVGLPTIIDILAELEKPGRDPRPAFKTASFKDGVETLADLEEGMVLEGTVTNVTHFGAFVDIGVHQDGLVHISALANRFVKDPHEVVKAGDIVKVKVMEVDVARKRIALSMRLEDKAEKSTPKKAQPQNRGGGQPRQSRQNNKPVSNSAFADAFAKAKKGR